MSSKRLKQFKLTLKIKVQLEAYLKLFQHILVRINKFIQQLNKQKCLIQILIKIFNNIKITNELGLRISFQMRNVSYRLLEKSQVQILYIYLNNYHQFMEQETKIKLNENKQQSIFIYLIQYKIQIKISQQSNRNKKYGL
ncbi:unnamed protein product [Paramecium sonneborni]|uniref:Uncharacterized protein n=1 Tax=Paramecium sonneborni TaxID=65129 RepID=A0A8S1RCL0_9CILI|nr:unnamed protein product [Paramecium sonneborni]